MHKIFNFLLKKRKISKRFVAIFVIVSVLMGVYTVFDNFRIDTDYITVSSPEIAGSFDGFKIAHISDYHNRMSQTVDSRLLSVLTAEKPDVIFLTGDLIDCRKTDVATALEFTEKLLSFAPVYYVTGNHECNFSILNKSCYDSFIADLKKLGVTVMSNSTMDLTGPDGSHIYLHGIEDPYFNSADSSGISSATDTVCSSLQIEDGFNILLAHHPEQLGVYSKYGFDLVFSGHAHGGQITLFGLGILAPDQAIFPQYTSGLYENGGTKLILSRGIGYSIAPVRVFCSPHLIITQLSSE